jgi:hypothetical protein
MTRLTFRLLVSPKPSKNVEQSRRLRATAGGMAVIGTVEEIR